MINKTPGLVVKNLLDLIIKRAVKPGDKLPSTAALAKTTGTSIISAREAIKNLAAIGVVEIRHGRGIFISDGGPVIEELLEARKVIESHNAMMAARYINDSLLNDLKNLLTMMDEDLRNKDSEAYSERDYEFHMLIGKASGNRILLKALENIRNLLHYQLIAINKVSGNMEKSVALHWELYHAITDKDPERANLIMARHIEDATAAWKKYNELLYGEEGEG